MRTKKLEKLTNIIEAILFAAGDAVPVDLLREKLEVTKREVDESIRQLEKKYTGACGIRLLQFNHKLQLATNPDYKEMVASVLMPIREKEFTQTILECAAIIAYKQPITRIEIEKIRRVKCDHAVNKLIEYNLVTEVGRLDAPGRPLLFGTTEDFLRKFGVKSIEELPEINSDKVAEFESEAEKEVQLKLDV